MKTTELIASGKAHSGALKWLKKEFDRIEKEPQYEKWNGTSYELMLLIVKGIYLACTWKGTSYAVSKALRIRAANAILGYHLYAIKRLNGIPIFGHAVEDYGIQNLKRISFRANNADTSKVSMDLFLRNPTEGGSYCSLGTLSTPEARRIKKMMAKAVSQLEKIV